MIGHVDSAMYDLHKLLVMLVFALSSVVLAPALQPRLAVAEVGPWADTVKRRSREKMSGNTVRPTTPEQHTDDNVSP
jgi:hypothetical protein